MRGVFLALVLLSTGALAQQSQDTSNAVAFFAPPDVALQSLKEVSLPEFPTDAPDKGEVICRFVITPEGTVSKVQDLFGDEPFLTSSVETIKQWRFSPFRVKGKKVEQDVVSQIGFHFERHAKKDPHDPDVTLIFPFGDFSHERQERRAQQAHEKISRVRVSGGVMQSQIISQARPLYPEIARANGVHGTVILHALIGNDGAIKLLHIERTPDNSLGSAALEAVKQWRYKPYKLNGEPIEVDTQIQVNFASY